VARPEEGDDAQPPRVAHRALLDVHAGQPPRASPAAAQRGGPDTARACPCGRDSPGTRSGGGGRSRPEAHGARTGGGTPRPRVSSSSGGSPGRSPSTARRTPAMMERPCTTGIMRSTAGRKNSPEASAASSAGSSATARYLITRSSRAPAQLICGRLLGLCHRATPPVLPNGSTLSCEPQRLCGSTGALGSDIRYHAPIEACCGSTDCSVLLGGLMNATASYPLDCL
jgi:hypothetical protein